MMSNLLAFLALSSLNVLATPHGHFHHNHAAYHMKRDNIEQNAVVTDWVSVTKTVEVTTTLWLTPNEAKPTQAANVNLNAPVQEMTIPSAIPDQIIELQPQTVEENQQWVKVNDASNKVTSSNHSQSDDTLDLPQLNANPISENNILTHPVDQDRPAQLTPETPVVANTSPISNKTEFTDHVVAASQCSSDQPCNGDITFYDPGVGAGACGWLNTKDEPVVALPHEFMGLKSNNNPFCGKTVTIVHNGKTSTAKVVDKCMGCSGFSIDLSNSVFSQLEALSVGRTNAKWWVN